MSRRRHELKSSLTWHREYSPSCPSDRNEGIKDPGVEAGVASGQPQGTSGDLPVLANSSKHGPRTVKGQSKTLRPHSASPVLLRRSVSPGPTGTRPQSSQSSAPYGAAHRPVPVLPIKSLSKWDCDAELKDSCTQPMVEGGVDIGQLSLKELKEQLGYSYKEARQRAALLEGRMNLSSELTARGLKETAGCGGGGRVCHGEQCSPDGPHRVSELHTATGRLCEMTRRLSLTEEFQFISTKEGQEETSLGTDDLPKMYVESAAMAQTVGSKGDMDVIRLAEASLQEMQDWLTCREVAIASARSKSRYLSQDVGAYMRVVESMNEVVAYQQNQVEKALHALRRRGEGHLAGQDEVDIHDGATCGIALPSSRSCNQMMTSRDPSSGPTWEEQQQAENTRPEEMSSDMAASKLRGATCNELQTGTSCRPLTVEQLPGMCPRTDGEAKPPTTMNSVPGIPHEARLASQRCGVEIQDISQYAGVPKTQGPLPSRKLPSHRLMSDPSVLFMSDCGLSPQQLGRVHTALEASNTITRLYLTGNLLVDSSIEELLRLLTGTTPPRITDLDISRNTNLTWRCAQHVAQMLSRRLVQPRKNMEEEPVTVKNKLRLCRLGMNGIHLGDKGAAVLAGPLVENVYLKVLELQRCGIADLGGAILCEALGQNGGLSRVDLSWNALAKKSAAALISTLQVNTSLVALDLAHNALADMDGAGVIASLSHNAYWRYINLANNTLESGAALCTAHLLEVFMKDPPAVLTRTSNQKELGTTTTLLPEFWAPTDAAQLPRGVTPNAPATSPPLDVCSRHNNARATCDSVYDMDAASEAGHKGSQELWEEANEQLLQKWDWSAAQGCVVEEDISSDLDDPEPCSRLTDTREVSTTRDHLEPSRCSKDVCCSTSLSVATGGAGRRSFPGLERDEQGSSMEMSLQHTVRTIVLDGNPLGMAGVRALLRTMSTLLRQIQPEHDVLTTLGSEIEARQDEAVTAQPQNPNGVACNMLGGGGPLDCINRCSEQNVSWATASPESHRIKDVGLDIHVSILNCGLMDKDKGVQMLSQGESSESLSGNPCMLTLADAVDPQPSLAPASTISTTPLSSRKDLLVRTPAASQVKGQLRARPPGSGGLQGGTTPSCQRLNEKSSTLDLASPAGAYTLNLMHPASLYIFSTLLKLRASLIKERTSGSGDSVTAGVAGQVRNISNPGGRVQSVTSSSQSGPGGVPVKLSSESISLTDIQLNGVTMRLDKLLSILHKHQGASSTLSFSVKGPVIIQKQEPLVLPPGLLDWLLKLLNHALTTEPWKLQAIEVMFQLHLGTPDQMLQLLATFHPELGQEEKLRAGLIMYASMTQPLLFWEEILPSFRPPQQEEIKKIIGSLGPLDIRNLTDRYVLKLSRPLDLVLARRLQLSSLQEAAWLQNHFFVNWRNVQFNGQQLRKEEMARLQMYAIPQGGTLVLDYVSYGVPDVGETLASHDEFRGLLRNIRYANGAYQRALLQLREEFLPFGRLASDVKMLKEATKLRMKRLKGAVAVLRAGGFPKKSPPEAESNMPGSESQVDACQETPLKVWWNGTGFNPQPLLNMCARLSTTPPSSMHGTAQGQRKTVRSRRSSDEQKRSRPGSPPISDRPSTPEMKRSSGGALNKDIVGLTKKKTEAKCPQFLGTLDAQVQEQVYFNIARLFQCTASTAVAREFSHLSDRYQHLVLTTMTQMASGPAVVAKLMEALSPIVVVRLLYCLLDDVTPLLGPAERSLVEPLLAPEVKLVVKEVAQKVHQAAEQRVDGIKRTVRMFLSSRCISTQQLLQVVRAVRYRNERCTCILASWSRVTDRANLVDVIESLSHAEQLELMHRLGYAHVWSQMARPNGLHFLLDLTDMEQREVARDVVKGAVRASMKEKMRSGQRVRHLQSLKADGRMVNDPEDEKLWLALESKSRVLEFDYVKTHQQEVALLNGMARRIQRFWQSFNAQRSDNSRDQGLTVPYDQLTIIPDTGQVETSDMDPDHAGASAIWLNPAGPVTTRRSHGPKTQRGQQVSMPHPWDQEEGLQQEEDSRPHTSDGTVEEEEEVLLDQEMSFDWPDVRERGQLLYLRKQQ